MNIYPQVKYKQQVPSKTSEHASLRFSTDQILLHLFVFTPSTCVFELPFILFIFQVVPGVARDGTSSRATGGSMPLRQKEECQARAPRWSSSTSAHKTKKKRKIKQKRQERLEKSTCNCVIFSFFHSFFLLLVVIRWRTGRWSFAGSLLEELLVLFTCLSFLPDSCAFSKAA